MLVGIRPHLELKTLKKVDKKKQPFRPVSIFEEIDSDVIGLNILRSRFLKKG